MPASVPYPSFTPNTVIASDEVNANFQAIVDFLNTQAVNADGSIAFSGIPTLPAAAPTGPNQATRKDYVDAGDLWTRAKVPRIAGGKITTVTSGGGIISIAHGQPWTPTSVVATLDYSGSGLVAPITNVAVQGISSTAITLHLTNSNTAGPVTSQSVTVYWVAYGGNGVT